MNSQWCCGSFLCWIASLLNLKNTSADACSPSISSNMTKKWKVSIAKVRMDIWWSLTYVCLTTDWYKHNVWTRTLGRRYINCFIFIHPLLDQPYLQSLFISLLNAKRSVFSQIEKIVVLSSAQSSCYIGMILCSWKMLLGFNTIIKCRRLGWI